MSDVIEDTKNAIDSYLEATHPEEYVNEILFNIKYNYYIEDEPKRKNDKNCKRYKVSPKAAEVLYAKYHSAKNIATEDGAFDSIKENTCGIGVKTFTNTSAQKVGEFGHYIEEYKNLIGVDLAKKILTIHNSRIEDAIKSYGLKYGKYHCVMIDQKNEQLRICEFPLSIIDIDKVYLVDNASSTSISFTDDRNEYRFYYAKNVLLRKFVLDPKITLSKHIDLKSNLGCPKWLLA